MESVLIFIDAEVGLGAPRVTVEVVHTVMLDEVKQWGHHGEGGTGHFSDGVRDNGSGRHVGQPLTSDVRRRSGLELLILGILDSDHLSLGDAEFTINNFRGVHSLGLVRMGVVAD